MKITFFSLSKNSVRKEREEMAIARIFVLYTKAKKARKAIVKLFCVIRKHNNNC